MLGRAAAGFGCFLMVAVAAFPQCSYTPAASAHVRSTILDLSLDGNDLWAATGYGVALYDRSVDPPLLVASLGLPGNTVAVGASRGVAYVASGSTINVVRRDGRRLRVSGSVDAGATVNDLLLTTNELYAATAAGLFEYDLLNPDAPAKQPATFATSNPNVTSLALSRTTLYAADGDSSVEVFSVSVPALPQRLGSIASLPRSTYVHAADGRIYVSDGLQTDIFAGTDANVTRAAPSAFPFGTSSWFPLSQNAIFAAGTDRRLRAFDVTTSGSPIEVFRSDLPSSAGTTNRIGAIAGDASRLFVAAGDAGIGAFDIGGVAAPFPVRSYLTGGTTSVFVIDVRVFTTPISGGIVEMRQSPASTVTEVRRWDRTHPDVVYDGAAELLLSGSGASVTLWALSPTLPTEVATATFRSPVRAAVLVGTTAYAVLEDHTLWSADLSQIAPAANQISISSRPSTIVRDGNSVALEELRTDATTDVIYYAGADFARAPSVVNVPGIGSAGIAMNGSRVAVWTFRGITLIDFNGSTTVLPGTNATAPQRLVLQPAAVAEITDTALIVWTLDGTLINRYPIPSTPVALALSADTTTADIATQEGIATVALGVTAKLPVSAGFTPAGNAYYKKIAATPSRVDLYDGHRVDIYDRTLHYTGSVADGAIVDFASANDALFTVTSNLSVNAYTRDGELTGSAIITDAGAQPLAIDSVNGVAWASIVHGCPLNCDKSTIVLDPRNSMGESARLTGAVRDVVTSGTRAYALTELPNEVRVIDVSDPAHPRQIASRPSEGAALPVSIGYANGTVYVLGDKLYAYADSDLSKRGEQFPPYAADPASPVTYADQHLGFDGACAAVTGRTFAPQLFSASAPTAWNAAGAAIPPSTTRSVASQPGVFYFLTDHSIEIWSTAPLPPPAKRHAAR